MPDVRLIAAAALLAACVVGAGCAGPPLLVHARTTGWTAEGTDQVWRAGKVEVVAVGEYEPVGDYPFGGALVNRGAVAVRVAFRPIAARVAEPIVGEIVTGLGDADPTSTIRAGDVVVIPPRGRDSPAFVRFRLPRTEGERAIRSDGGVSFGHTPDGTHYSIELAGTGVDATCDFFFDVVRVPRDEGVPWYSYLALPLLPLYLVSGAD
jgi:hypothetical protein